tara:strand:+ start:257 stop:664 length:408 start_codon:yes stop_codon:yes gene_type:complete
MINAKPIIALSLVLIAFLISISIAFLDMLGPKIPLPRKSISKILKTSNDLPLLSNKENKVAKSTKELAKLYLGQETLVQGYSNLNFNKNLSDPEKGKFTFLTVVCYGNSEKDCIYLNSYLKSFDYGDTWKIGFLE